MNELMKVAKELEEMGRKLNEFSNNPVVIKEGMAKEIERLETKAKETVESIKRSMG